MMRLLFLWLALTTVGCAGSTTSRSVMTLATTTSTRDSGLLDALIPPFQKQTGIEIKVVAVGSGQALEMGRRGDADALLTHAPAEERDFVASGYGAQRYLVMHNDFVLIGPKHDPANIRGMKSVTGALRRIADSKALFVSRGDDSGTHIKEKNIWKQLSLAPSGEWYLESGTGMAQALRIANEKRAFALTDRGTFLSHCKHLDLVILCEGDPLLRNQYAVIVINPDKHPHVRNDLAEKWAKYLLSSKAQELIGRFGVETFGEPLFFPND